MVVLIPIFLRRYSPNPLPLSFPPHNTPKIQTQRSKVLDKQALEAPGPRPRAPLERDLQLARAFEAEVQELRALAQLISTAESTTPSEAWKANPEVDAALVSGGTAVTRCPNSIFLLTRCPFPFLNSPQRVTCSGEMLPLSVEQPVLRLGLGDDDSVDIQVNKLGTFMGEVPSLFRVDIIRDEATK